MSIATPRHVVITGVRSATHLVHIASYLRFQLTRLPAGTALSVAYVGGGPFLGRTAVTVEDARRLFPQDERLTLTEVEGAPRWACPPGRSLTYVAVGAPGLKPWAQLRKANPRKRIHVLVTDEGIGTYGDWRTRRDAWARQGVPEPWRSVRVAAVTGGARALTGERWPLYRHTAGTWHVHEEVAQEFRRHTDGVEAAADADRVVILTQPWVDLGLLTEDGYRDHLRTLVQTVAAAGGRARVRPHPAEPLGRYADLPVLLGDGPAELDPEVVSAGAVVGGTSTALLNLAAVFGLRAARVTAPGTEHLEVELSAGQRTLLDTYVSAPVPAQQLPARLGLA